MRSLKGNVIVLVSMAESCGEAGDEQEGGCRDRYAEEGVG